MILDFKLILLTILLFLSSLASSFDSLYPYFSINFLTLSLTSIFVFSFISKKRYYASAWLFILLVFSFYVSILLFFGDIFYVNPSLYNAELFSTANLLEVLNLSIFASYFSILTLVLGFRYFPLKHRTTNNIIFHNFSLNKLYLAPKVALNLLFIIPILFLTLSFIQPTILSVQYPFQKWYQLISGPVLYVPVLLNLFAFISFAKYQNSRIIPLALSFLSVFFSLTMALLFVGSRGGAIPLFIGLIIFFFSQVKKYSRFTIKSLFLFFGLFLCSFALISLSTSFVYLRGILHSFTLNPITFWPFIFHQSIDIFTLFSSLFTDLELHFGFSQALFQYLEVINLNNLGSGNGLQSFINLFPQAVPSQISDFFFTRPPSDSELIQALIPSGGGFWVPANLYWNTSFLGLTIGIILICMLIIFCDKYRPVSGWFGQSIYWIVLPIFATSLFYGLQGLMRCLELVSLFVFLGSRLSFK